jgi:hypothetical protein
MPKPQHVDPGVEIGIEFPLDGSYSPRVVGPGFSAWLRPGEIGLEEPGIFNVRNTGQKCEITHLDPNREVMVNGQPLVGRRVLRDGDFIHTKETRGIFQQDPVADYRHHWEKQFKLPRLVRLQITNRLEKHVRIDTSGVSLDGGKTTTAWTHFAGVVVQILDSNSWKVAVYKKHEGQPAEEMRTKCVGVVGGEVDLLLKWFHHTAPYEISVLSASNVQFSDAYVSLAHTKIINPARENKRLLPMSIAFILGFPTRKQIALRFMLRVGFAALGAAMFSAGAVFHPLLFLLIMSFVLLLQFRWIKAELHYLRELPKYETLERPLP